MPEIGRGRGQGIGEGGQRYKLPVLRRVGSGDVMNSTRSTVDDTALCL